METNTKNCALAAFNDSSEVGVFITSSENENKDDDLKIINGIHYRIKGGYVSHSCMSIRYLNFELETSSKKRNCWAILY